MEKSIFLSKVTFYLSFYTHNSEIIFNNTFILFLLISTKSATLGRVFLKIVRPIFVFSIQK